jgi:methyl-accepting chemotaxis protein
MGPLQFLPSKFLAARRKLFHIDDAACAAVARFRPMVESVLPDAIDAFIAADSNMPTVMDVFRAHGAEIRAAELRHYRVLFSGDLGGAYVDSCADLCAFHARIGLSPRVRATCGNVVIGALLDRLARRSPFSGRAVAEAARLFASFVNFDMATMMSTFEAASARAVAEREAAINDAITAFETAVTAVIGNLQGAARELSGQTQAMLGGVAETNLRTRSATQTAVQVEANVQATLQSSSELQLSIAEISRQGLKSLDMAGLVGEQSKATMAAMQELTGAAREIGSITRTISALADQTSLLSLNATIEAAHAGAAGRGFAIVAGEVKNLSRQTRTAAHQIGEQIAAVQEASARSADQIAAVAGHMGELMMLASAISGAVCEQEAATRSISATVRQTADATAQAGGDVKAIEKVASQNVAVAEELDGWAKRLTRDASQLGAEVDTFFRRVRQA